MVKVTHAEDASCADKDLDLVVSQLRRVSRDAALEFALSVGAILLHHFYQGDLAAWRDRGPRDASFRRLSQRPDLPLSPAALYRCVATFELCDRLDAVSRWKHLNASHLRCVLGLDHALQVHLLSQANQRRLTVIQLENEVTKVVCPEGRKGRPPRPRLVNAVSALSRCLEVNQEVFANTRAEALNATQLVAVREALSRVRQALDCVERRLHTEMSVRESGISELAAPCPAHAKR